VGNALHRTPGGRAARPHVAHAPCFASVSGTGRECGAHERRIEDLVSHHLTALHQPVLMRAIIGNGMCSVPM